MYSGEYILDLKVFNRKNLRYFLEKPVDFR
jgi:hypothetical protein